MFSTLTETRFHVEIKPRNERLLNLTLDVIDEFDRRNLTRVNVLHHEHVHIARNRGFGTTISGRELYTTIGLYMTGLLPFFPLPFEAMYFPYFSDELTAFV